MLAQIPFAMGDTVRDHNRVVTDNVASLSRQLDERRNERVTLSFTPVTSDQVTDAQKAVAEAITAREQECGKVGDNSRKRVAELNDRQYKLSGLQSNKAIGDHAAELDTEISSLENQISALGPAPLMQGPVAARLSMWTFGTLSAGAVSDGLPTALSLVAELCALFGPFIFLGGQPQSAAIRASKKEPAPRRAGPPGRGCRTSRSGELMPSD